MAKFQLVSAGEVCLEKTYPALTVIEGFKVEKTEEVKVAKEFSKEALVEYLEEDPAHSVNDTFTRGVEWSFEAEVVDDLRRLSSAVGRGLFMDFSGDAGTITIYDDYME